MTYKKRIRAFSLTELLIVLMVIAFLFAAMAPIITKRRLAQGDWMNESVWNFVSGDSYKDSYFDPGVSGWPSIAFIGLDPDRDNLPKEDLARGGKLTIRAIDGQRHIQFRLGSDTGAFAGTFTVNKDDGMFLGTGFDDNLDGEKNAIAGYNAAGKVGNKALTNSTIIGSYSLFNPANMNKNLTITAVGNSAATDYGSAESPIVGVGSVSNTFVGSNAGRTINAPVGNVAVGYNSMFTHEMSGGYNTAVGSETGQGITTGSNNVFAATKFINYSGSNNTILGYGTYENKNPDINYLTAVGEHACDSMTNNSTGRKTCIGYFSAAQSNGTAPGSTGLNDADSERIFIGGVPKGGFFGRSVLEVHNVNKKDSNGKNTNGTVILNSNLVLNGELYTSASMDTGSNTDWGNYVITDYRHTSISKPFSEGQQCSHDKWVHVFGHKKYYCTGWSTKKSSSTNNLFKRDHPSQSFSYSMSGAYPNLSDMRLKENIKESGAGLENILKLQPYNYTFKSDKNKTPQVGVIAQDLKKVFPDSVTKAKDGYYHIRWDEMFYALINSIKTLNAKVEKIASDILNITSDTKNLENNNKLFKKKIADLNARAAKLEKK